ncbi:MAG: 4Fe-4S dicluster domain-containing protein [Deltaproteobacteria bacterium]|nr:4Fe-4S dicluster domain-containing protein [Deltaproteobacteria bacterium]
MKVIGVHLDRCTGCKTCELYCAVERGSNGKTLLKAAQESPVPKSRVRVEGNNQIPIPLQCRHCLEAPCLDACLTGAMTREAKSNMVVVQEDRCIACWTCTLFCPYGVIYPWPERKMALKCDRCTYMENPVCVEVCPCQALELVELGELEEMLRPRRKEVTRALQENNKKGFLLLDLD